VFIDECIASGHEIAFNVSKDVVEVAYGFNAGSNNVPLRAGK